MTISMVLNPIRAALKKQTAPDYARVELAAAERAKLEAESALEYAKAVVGYREKQINRLREYLKEIEA